MVLLPSKEEAEEEEKTEVAEKLDPIPVAESAESAAAPNGAAVSSVSHRRTRSLGHPVVTGFGQVTKRKGGRF